MVRLLLIAGVVFSIASSLGGCEKGSTLAHFIVIESMPVGDIIVLIVAPSTEAASTSSEATTSVASTEATSKAASISSTEVALEAPSIAAAAIPGVSSSTIGRVASSSIEPVVTSTAHIRSRVAASV